MEASNFGDLNKQEVLARLTAEHAALKARVHELEQRVSLSTAEQVEVVRLKKLKLLTKDRLYALQHPH